MFSKQLNKEYMVMEKVIVYLGKTGSNELDIDMIWCFRILIYVYVLIINFDKSILGVGR